MSKPKQFTGQEILDASKKLAKWFYPQFEGACYLDEDDYVQEIAIALTEAVDECEECVESLIAFGKRKAYFVFVDQCRAANWDFRLNGKSIKPTLIPVEDHHLGFDGDYSFNFTLVSQIFSKISDYTGKSKYLEILYSRFYLGKTLEEVGVDQGTSLDVVYYDEGKALGFLREQFDSESA